MRRKIVPKFLKWAAVLAVLVVAIAALGLGYRAYRQHKIADAITIRSANGIDEAMFVKIGGIEQWLQIRGEDKSNPVILIVHGGPGVSLMAYTPIFQSWEKYFIVVQWDQRGDGKTFGRNGEVASEPMTINRMTRDGIEVSQYLLHHLHKKKIVLLGHSWGSVLGVRIVKARPDLFSAYVGTGQIVSEQPDLEAAYIILMKKVRNVHDQRAIADLEAAGPPPYKDAKASLPLRKWLDVYSIAAERDLTANVRRMILVAPNYSLWDIYDFFAAARFSKAQTYAELNAYDAELNAYDARKLGPDFALPVFIIEGDDDLITPATFARQYFDWIRAPQKTFVLLKDAGHSAMLTVPDEFLQALVAHVRPVASEKQ